MLSPTSPFSTHLVSMPFQPIHVKLTAGSSPLYGLSRKSIKIYMLTCQLICIAGSYTHHAVIQLLMWCDPDLGTVAFVYKICLQHDIAYLYHQPSHISSSHKCSTMLPDPSDFTIGNQLEYYEIFGYPPVEFELPRAFFRVPTQARLMS